MLVDHFQQLTFAALFIKLLRSPISTDLHQPNFASDALFLFKHSDRNFSRSIIRKASGKSAWVFLYHSKPEKLFIYHLPVRLSLSETRARHSSISEMEFNAAYAVSVTVLWISNSFQRKKEIHFVVEHANFYVIFIDSLIWGETFLLLPMMSWNNKKNERKTKTDASTVNLAPLLDIHLMPCEISLFRLRFNWVNLRFRIALLVWQMFLMDCWLSSRPFYSESQFHFLTVRPISAEHFSLECDWL